MASDYIPSENLNPLSPNGIALAKGKKIKPYPRVRPTSEEYQERLDAMVDYVSSGMYLSDAKRLFCQRFNVESNTAIQYVSRARRELAKVVLRPLTEWKNESLLLYAQQSRDLTLSAQDRRKARERLDKLLGLDAATSIKIEDLDRLIDLEQQRIAGLGQQQLTVGSVEGELVPDDVHVGTSEATNESEGISG